MNEDFGPLLKGSETEANTAKQEIAKHFKQYGDSDRQDAKKNQLKFANKILFLISKSEQKHLGIYCQIITEIFSHQLQPEASIQYWTLYANYILYFHYLLVEKVRSK